MNGQAIPLGDAPRGAGPGDWLQALGAVLILTGALGLLFSPQGRYPTDPEGRMPLSATAPGGRHDRVS